MGYLSAIINGSSALILLIELVYDAEKFVESFFGYVRAAEEISAIAQITDDIVSPATIPENGSSNETPTAGNLLVKSTRRKIS